MTGEVAAAWVQAGAAALTFGATALAVRAAYKGPERAPQFAGNLRKDSIRDKEDRRLKLHVLASLISHRATIADPQSISAFNLIPFVFAKDRAVRDAVRTFLDAADTRPFDSVRLGSGIRSL